MEENENNIEILRQRLYKTQNYLGEFNPVRPGGYDQLDQCSLFGCVWESKHDDNVTAPAQWDGGDVIIPNTEDWKHISGSYDSWLLSKDRPATTGTTGDYPYNGMGLKVLKKNMVNTEGDVFVNLLNQDAFEDKDGNALDNTVFVIKYDFITGENITLPENSVLKFEGGSIGGENTLTGSNTGIMAGVTKIFDTSLALEGTFTCKEAFPEWWGADCDGITPANIGLNKCFAFCVLNGIGFDGKSKKYIVDNSTSMFGHFGVYVPGGISIRNLGLKLKQGSIDYSTLMICKYDDNDYLIENCSFEGELRTPTVGAEDGANHGIVFCKTNTMFPDNWQEAGNVTIRNCKFNNIQSYGIFPTPIKSKLVVDNCDFACHACGILSYAVDCEIRNCTYKYLDSEGSTVHTLAIDEIENFSEPDSVKKNILISGCKSSVGIYNIQQSTQTGVKYGNIEIENSYGVYVNIDNAVIPADKVVIRNCTFSGNSNLNKLKDTEIYLENCIFDLILNVKGVDSCNLEINGGTYKNRLWVHGSTFEKVVISNCKIEYDETNTDGFLNARWGTTATIGTIVIKNCVSNNTLVYEVTAGKIIVDGLVYTTNRAIINNVSCPIYIEGLVCDVDWSGGNYAFVAISTGPVIIRGISKGLDIYGSSITINDETTIIQ